MVDVTSKERVARLRAVFDDPNADKWRRGHAAELFAIIAGLQEELEILGDHAESLCMSAQPSHEPLPALRKIAEACLPYVAVEADQETPSIGTADSTRGLLLTLQAICAGGVPQYSPQPPAAEQPFAIGDKIEWRGHYGESNDVGIVHVKFPKSGNAHFLHAADLKRHSETKRARTVACSCDSACKLKVGLQLDADEHCSELGE